MAGPWSKVRWVAIVLMLTGCGSSASLHPVVGRVSLEGAPLNSGEVVFVPDAEKGNTFSKSPEAEIEAGGTFQLTTDGRPGAPAGWYLVTVATQTPSAPRDAPVIPARYTRVRESGLALEVKPNSGAADFDINLLKK